MAKRMKFSVVGLPHYTVWHLYEPSVDDIRHMEEMEQEKQAREAEEKERAERMKKVKDEFHEPVNQWENDKAQIKDMEAKDASGGILVGDEEGPIAQPIKETVETIAESAGEGTAAESNKQTDSQSYPKSSHET